MLVFIDESGDPGFGGKSAKQYFIISLIIFEDYEEANKIERSILNLKKKLNHKTEFKFSKSSNLVRDSFFNKIKDDLFKVKALAVNKDVIHSEFLKSNSKKFYNFILKELVTKVNLENSIIKIDGKGNRRMTRELRSYLRQGNDLRIKKLKFEDSKNNVLIQMADMIASCIGYSYNRSYKRNSNRWRYLIERKIDIWEFK